jgi:hypothetical protein
MAIWKIGSVEEYPDVELYNWKIMHMAEGSFFVGDEHGSGRVSTDIITYDPKNNVGQTRSGRVYKLIGKQTDISRNAEYVWDHYKSVNNLTEIESVKIE